MTKLTIDVSSAVLRQARKIALSQGTTINALLGSYINAAISSEHRAPMMKRLVQRARESGGRSRGPWSRNELYQVEAKR
jgi:hypothetical protein